MSDRSIVTVSASSAKVANGNSAATRVPVGSQNLAILVNATALVGTPNVVLSVEWSHDGTTFAQVDTTADAFAAITTVTTTKVKTVSVKGDWFRVVWVVTGGTPSLTFSVTAYGV